MDARTSLPYFKGVPRQRGRGLGSLAGTVVSTAFPILKKYYVPAAKRIGRDLFETGASEVGNVLSGKTNIKKR